MELLDKSLRTIDKFENFEHGHDLKLSTNCVNNKEKSYCCSLYWPLFRTSCTKDNDGNMCISAYVHFFKISNDWKYSFSLRFPLFPLTPNLFHFKYVKVKNCTEIITMFFSRSSYTRALKFRYKLNIKRTNANKAIWLTSFDAKGSVRMTLESERYKSTLHCLPILYCADKNLSLM